MGAESLANWLSGVRSAPAPTPPGLFSQWHEGILAYLDVEFRDLTTGVLSQNGPDRNQSYGGNTIFADGDIFASERRIDEGTECSFGTGKIFRNHNNAMLEPGVVQVKVQAWTIADLFNSPHRETLCFHGSGRPRSGVGICCPLRVKVQPRRTTSAMKARPLLLWILLCLSVPVPAGPLGLEGTWCLLETRRHDYAVESDWEMTLTLQGGVASARVNEITYIYVTTTEGCLQEGHRGPVRELRGTYRVLDGERIVFSWEQPGNLPLELFGTEHSAQEWPYKLDNALRVNLPERWLLFVPPGQMP